MILLGIESSCDETAASVLKATNGKFKVLSNVVSSQVATHAKYGGVVPEVAARLHIEKILPIVHVALREAELALKDLDAIAVCGGPGLISALLVGVETAKTLAYIWQKPLIPINHLQAHLYANWLRPNNKEPKFPAIGLVVSGGHTDLVLMKNHRQIKWLGGTRDDAAGECFDKCARLLGLGYPGGPAISKEAKKLEIGNSKLENRLPRPMINDDNFDFSFSGLKTAVLNRIKEQESKKVKVEIASLAYEIQEAITDVLVEKTLRATEKYKAKSVLLAGGVVANPRLREKFFSSFSQFSSISLFVPKAQLCTDNATFIASCAYFNFHPVPFSQIHADSSLGIEEMIKS